MSTTIQTSLTLWSSSPARYPGVARRRTYVRDNVQFCARIEYQRENPFPGANTHVYVYFRDTLSLALLNGDYEVAALIVRSGIGRWTYNTSQRVTQGLDEMVENCLTLLTPHERRRRDRLREVSHTACFLEGYFRQWFHPYAENRIAIPESFVETFLFAEEWSDKYREIANYPHKSSITHRRLLKEAIMQRELPEWIGRRYPVEGEEMCRQLGLRLYTYIQANNDA